LLLEALVIHQFSSIVHFFSPNDYRSRCFIPYSSTILGPIYVPECRSLAIDSIGVDEGAETTLHVRGKSNSD